MGFTELTLMGGSRGRKRGIVSVGEKTNFLWVFDYTDYYLSDFLSIN